MDELLTASDVIDALGGTSKVARLTGRSMQAVSNWRERGAFPAETFLLLGDALGKAGRTAPASLWGMLAAAEASAA